MVEFRNAAYAVARAFVDELRGWLGVDTLARIDAENAQRRDGSCASHDHCDANMAMFYGHKALARRWIGFPPLTVDLMNEAWSIACGVGFARLTLASVRGGQPVCMGGNVFALELAETGRPTVHLCDAGGEGLPVYGKPMAFSVCDETTGEVLREQTQPEGMSDADFIDLAVAAAWDCKEGA